MPEWRVFAVVSAIGAASYAMRAGGFQAASALLQSGRLPRLLRLAPGNLFVAFTAAGILEGGWPTLVGCLNGRHEARVGCIGRRLRCCCVNFCRALIGNIDEIPTGDGAITI